MIGADTNILVRFLIGDIEEQMVKVADLMTSGEQIYINASVLTELTWVLTASYKFTKPELVEAYDLLMECSGIIFFDSDLVSKALAQFIVSSAGFNDCMINQINLKKGINTKTFDKKASKLDGMELLG